MRARARPRLSAISADFSVSPCSSYVERHLDPSSLPVQTLRTARTMSETGRFLNKQDGTNVSLTDQRNRRSLGRKLTYEVKLFWSDGDLGTVVVFQADPNPLSKAQGRTKSVR